MNFLGLATFALFFVLLLTLVIGGICTKDI